MKKPAERERTTQGQVFIVTLWIFLILTILVLTLGRHVILSLRLARYHREKASADFLSHAALAKAVDVLKSDALPEPNVDTLGDAWAENEEFFKSIGFTEEEKKYAYVGYNTGDAEAAHVHYGVVDEERKINLNTAPAEVLLALFEACSIPRSQEAVDNLLIWRGDKPDDGKKYKDMGYAPKGGKFLNTTELVLVGGVAFEDYLRMQDKITVFGDGRLNINTVSGDILTIFSDGIATKLSLPADIARSVVSKIIDERNKKGYFRSVQEISLDLFGSEEQNLLSELAKYLGAESSHFLIEAHAFSYQVRKEITAVYSRRDERFLFWHES